MTDLAAELSRLPTGTTTSPWNGYERAVGYAVMNLPFSSGHHLGLRVFPQTDFGGYVSVWHRDPNGAWAQYVADAPVEAGCPRVWGPALSHAAPADISVRWSGPMKLEVVMSDPGLDWRLSLGETLPLKILNALHGRFPLGTWRSRSLVALRERILRWLGLGAVSLAGRAPTGEQLVAALRRMYWVTSASATLNGEDLGVPRTIDECPTIGRWPLPRRPVFAVGDAHATIGDRAEYDRLRRQVDDNQTSR